MPETESTPPVRLKFGETLGFRFGLLLFLWVLNALVLLPLYLHPYYLHSLLPAAQYYAWDRFAETQLEGITLAISWLGISFSLLFCIAVFFKRKISWNARIGQALLYLLLVFMWYPISLGACSRENSRRNSCVSQLKLATLLLTQYAENNADYFPPDLQTIADASYDFHLCPARTQPGKEFSDYLYYGAGRKLSDPPFLLLQDCDGNHPGIYYNNIFSDGKVTRGPKEPGER